ncbi:hypothetical protein CR513_39476, partial [Mucuna pruriens]
MGHWDFKFSTSWMRNPTTTKLRCICRTRTRPAFMTDNHVVRPKKRGATTKGQWIRSSLTTSIATSRYTWTTWSSSPQVPKNTSRTQRKISPQVQKYDMRLNLDKCVFGVQGGKFLGFMLTHRGIEANFDKCNTNSTQFIPLNRSLRWRLTGWLASLVESSRNGSTLLPTPQEANIFPLNDDCEKAFQDEFLAFPPVLTRLRLERCRAPYNASTRRCKVQSPQYQMIKKLVLALVTSTQQLCPSHTMVVQTDHPIRQVLQNLELVKRMTTWLVELSEFVLKFEPRGAIKTQNPSPSRLLGRDDITFGRRPMVGVDDSSNPKGGGADIILEGPKDITLEYSLKFDFKASRLKVGALQIRCHTDSQPVAKHIKGTYQVLPPGPNRTLKANHDQGSPTLYNTLTCETHDRWSLLSSPTTPWPMSRTTRRGEILTQDHGQGEELIANLRSSHWESHVKFLVGTCNNQKN